MGFLVLLLGIAALPGVTSHVIQWFESQWKQCSHFKTCSDVIRRLLCCQCHRELNPQQSRLCRGVQEDVPAKAFQWAKGLPWGHSSREWVVDAMALTVWMWPLCSSSSWKWWVLHSFLKLAKDVTCSPKRGELVEFFMFWSPSRCEGGQGVLRELCKNSARAAVFARPPPWEFKSCKILRAFESSLRSSWILYLSPR